MPWATEIFRTGKRTPAADSPHLPGSSGAHSPTAVSICYDNGTGYISAEVASQLRHQGKVPSHVRNTEQLAAFISTMPPDPQAHPYMVPSRSPPSPHPLQPVRGPAPARTATKKNDSTGRHGTWVSQLPGTMTSPQTKSINMWNAMSARYFAPAVATVIPTKTRKSKWERHWLQRGTLRKLPKEEIKERKKAWRKTTDQEEEGGKEVSGWYR